MQDKIVQDSKYNKWEHVNNIVPFYTSYYSIISTIGTVLSISIFVG